METREMKLDVFGCVKVKLTNEARRYLSIGERTLRDITDTDGYQKLSLFEFAKMYIDYRNFLISKFFDGDILVSIKAEDKKNKWVELGEDEYCRYECPNCGHRRLNISECNYCPNCGLKMTEDNECSCGDNGRCKGNCRCNH